MLANQWEPYALRTHYEHGGLEHASRNKAIIYAGPIVFPNEYSFLFFSFLQSRALLSQHYRHLPFPFGRSSPVTFYYFIHVR